MAGDPRTIPFISPGLRTRGIWSSSSLLCSHALGMDADHGSQGKESLYPMWSHWPLDINSWFTWTSRVYTFTVRILIFFNRSLLKEPMKRVPSFSHHKIKHIKWASIISKGIVNSIKGDECIGQRGKVYVLGPHQKPPQKWLKNEMLGIWCWITDLLTMASSLEMHRNILFLLSLLLLTKLQ